MEYFGGTTKGWRITKRIVFVIFLLVLCLFLYLLFFLHWNAFSIAWLLGYIATGIWVIAWIFSWGEPDDGGIPVGTIIFIIAAFVAAFGGTGFYAKNILPAEVPELKAEETILVRINDTAFTVKNENNFEYAYNSDNLMFGTVPIKDTKVIYTKGGETPILKKIVKIEGYVNHNYNPPIESWGSTTTTYYEIYIPEGTLYIIEERSKKQNY
jgi:hypothetical protein